MNEVVLERQERWGSQEGFLFCFVFYCSYFFVCLFVLYCLDFKKNLGGSEGVREGYRGSGR